LELRSRTHWDRKMIRIVATLAGLLLPLAAVASSGTVLSRHPDGRPAAVDAFGQLVHFGTQSGSSCADAIVLTDARDMPVRGRAQEVWIDAVYPGWKRVDLKVTSTQPPAPERIYSTHTLEDRSGKTRLLCFDLTDPMLAQAKAEAKAMKEKGLPTLPPVAEADVPRQVSRCVALFGLAMQGLEPGPDRDKYESWAKSAVRVAKLRGTTREQFMAWTAEVEGGFREEAAPPEIIAEMGRCPHFMQEQVDKLRSEERAAPAVD
jgi:hypothetical protein